MSPRPVANPQPSHRRLAALFLLGALSSCDAPQQAVEPVPARVQANPAPAPLSKQQADERSELCGKLAGEQFRRGWDKGVAEYTSHYSEKLSTCFYLLTIETAGTLKKMLYDVNGGELYGEYLGPRVQESPAARPKTCRVESIYCASWREWEVLIDPYMED